MNSALDYYCRRHRKETSFLLTNQELSVIINFQSIKTNLDSCQISSKFSIVLLWLDRWVYFWTFRQHREYSILRDIERAILCCTLFFLNGYLLSYTRRIYNDACLSLHEAASISRRVNAKYVCTNILYKFSIGSVNLKIVHLQHSICILSCSKIQPKYYQTHFKKVTIHP